MFTLGCFSKNYDKRYRFNATIVNFVKKTILTPLTFFDDISDHSRRLCNTSNIVESSRYYLYNSFECPR